MMKKLICLCSLLIFALISCDSDDLTIVETQGTVLDSGDPAADGCGWLIRIDGINYSPTYLNSQYRQDSLTVLIKAEFLTSTFTCGISANDIPQIRIEQIRPY